MFEARIAPTPKDTVHRDGRGSVYRFRGAARAGSHVPVLLVPSMIHRWYVLDLREGASLAGALSAGAPWDTYCFDWGVPEDEDRYVSWDDIIGRLDRVIRRVLRMTGAPKLAIVGHCMGATLSAIYAALNPSKVAAFVNLAGPFDFAEAGRLRMMVDERWFDPAAMTAPGNLGGAQMLGGFHALAPTQTISRWVAMADKLHDSDALRAFHAVETWSNDQVPFPGEAYVTYIKELYQQNRLVRGEHYVRGERVDLSRIDCPLLTIVSERDTICPPKAATALNRVASSSVKDVLAITGGHISSVVGPNAPTELYPAMKTWLTQHGRTPSVRALSYPESRL
jgi:polyhydroxyalkanoate synthase